MPKKFGKTAGKSLGRIVLFTPQMMLQAPTYAWRSSGPRIELAPKTLAIGVQLERAATI
ncbi:MAG TPA: hypothetical protein VM709_06355 [Candidatus Sulfotelmatobacter sp.]|nr:hypothetical protein [Candidatus Sulfotelmatobacter sp.]